MNAQIIFATFVKKDSRYATQWLMNRFKFWAADEIFEKKPYRLTKKTDLNRKSKVVTKLDQSFQYLPYLAI